MSYFHLGCDADLMERQPEIGAVKSVGLRIVEIERLCHDEAISKAAFSAGNKLIENGWILWPAPCWDEPCIAVMDGDKCVAGVNYSRDDKQRYACVDFAFCDETKPQALAMCLLRARKRAAEAGLSEIRFTHHNGNEPMAKLVNKLGLEPHTLSFRVPLKRAA